MSKKIYVLRWAILLLFVSFSGWAQEAVPSSKQAYITTGSDTLYGLYGFLGQQFDVVENNEQVALLKVNEQILETISHHMHHEHKRCGGYIYHDNLKEARETMKAMSPPSSGKPNPIPYTYTIDQEDKVKNMVAMAQELSIRQVIEKLASFKTRHYQTQTGVDSSRWIAQHWRDLSSSRNDVSVELVKHSWKQESVIMTIQGSEKPEEKLVIGGHADSINGRSKRRAPGADDNASGIATISEVIRVAIASGYKPKKTVQFMAYAAEEVGLRGSGDIAKKYRRNREKVIGVMQLDMTGHHGTSDKEIVFMTDYTSREQNAFLGALIDTYLDYSWGYSRCGYGCSDHASWYRHRYAASIPFESTMEDINHKIHTTEDTLETMGGDASHSLKFAQLAIAYMIEMAK